MNLRACLALSICWIVSARVVADAGKQPWAFVPITAGGLPVARASALTSPLEAAVVAAGEPVLLNDDAAERIWVYSADPSELPSDAVSAVKRELDKEQNELAVQPDAAERLLERLSAEQKDIAAQDPSLAKQMEAICLTRLEYDVRKGAGDKVQPQAQLCRTLFPAFQPRAGEYPPDVLAALDSAPRHNVRVDGPAGCSILLNGKHVGMAPATLSVFSVAARLQLRCDGRSTRVHPIELGKAVRIAIDPALDAALHTERGLYLTSESVPLAKVGQWLGARVVPLHVQVMDGRIRVQLKGGARSAERRVLWYDLLRGYDPRELSAATQELLQGALVQATAPAVLAANASPQVAPTARASVPNAAIILGGAGVAMLAAGLVTGLIGRGHDAEIQRFGEECGVPCDPPLEQRVKLQQLQSDVQTLYTTTNVLAVAGGVSVVTAVGWALLWPDTVDEGHVSFLPFASPGAAGARVAARF